MWTILQKKKEKRVARYVRRDRRKRERFQGSSTLLMMIVSMYVVIDLKTCSKKNFLRLTAGWLP